jgi:hypothetical protein
MYSTDVKIPVNVEMYDLWEILHIPKRCGKFPKIVCAKFMEKAPYTHCSL